MDGVTLYTNVDALGSVHDTQTDGDYPRDQRRFEAFGGQVGGSGGDTFALGFAASSSYQTDADTGLMLLGNRYYDPSIGRFLSEDPSGDGGNWYAYCDNDPLGELDPTGLAPSGAPTGASYGDPLGQLFDIASFSSSIANGMGHWTHGAPDGHVKGRPTNEGGERYTDWIPSFGLAGLTFYRGGNDFTARLNSDFKVDKATGLVLPSEKNGVSVNTNPYDKHVQSRGAYRIKRVSNKLTFRQQGREGHYNLGNKEPMSHEELQEELNKTETEPFSRTDDAGRPVDMFGNVEGEEGVDGVLDLLP